MKQTLQRYAIRAICHLYLWARGNPWLVCFFGDFSDMPTTTCYVVRPSIPVRDDETCGHEHTTITDAAACRRGKNSQNERLWKIVRRDDYPLTWAELDAAREADTAAAQTTLPIPGVST
jgi:hypothetical protein